MQHASLINTSPAIEVFRTNVQTRIHANMLVKVLRDRFNTCRINFDLDDCDRILRVEGIGFCTREITAILSKQGFLCSILD